MCLFELSNNVAQKVLRYLVYSVVVVSEFWEISDSLKVNDDTVIIATINPLIYLIDFIVCFVYS